jgi:subtilisin family serine protease
LVRPIFSETETGDGDIPSAPPEELAHAILESIEAGARIVNLSAALIQGSSKGERVLGEALNYAARRGVIAVAAAGNQGTVGSSAITRHPWVIPVAACDSGGRPISQSNFGQSIGKRGLLAPGERISSLGPDGKSRTFGGTSAATPFVTGAIALLWSEFPATSAAQMKFSVTDVQGTRRSAVVPPLFDAWAVYENLAGKA